MTQTNEIMTKKETKKRYLAALEMFLLLTASFVFGITLRDNWTDVNLFLSSKFNGVTESPGECKDLSVSDTAYCLRKYVYGFYNYSQRANYPKNLEDIKQNGGSCYDYSLLYEDFISEIGYNVKKVTIYGDDYGHVFNIMWNDEMTEYCLIDQLNVDCHEIE